MSIEPHELRTLARERREKLGAETRLSKALDHAANEIERTDTTRMALLEAENERLRAALKAVLADRDPGNDVDRLNRQQQGYQLALSALGVSEQETAGK